MTGEEMLGRFQLGELLAVGWDDEMAARFPNVEHTWCLVDSRNNRCHGLHCNRCGAPTSAMGGHPCPDRP